LINAIREFCLRGGVLQAGQINRPNPAAPVSPGVGRTGIGEIRRDCAHDCDAIPS